MKKIFKRTSLLLISALMSMAAAQAQKSPQDMDRFIDALMKKMTVEEKIEPTRHRRHYHRTGQKQ
jgi:beta-glucosidase